MIISSNNCKTDEAVSGLTFIEVLVSVAILFVLASVALPLSHITKKREKEVQLRRNLRKIRTAIDLFKADWDNKVISHTEGEFANIETGYPLELSVLTAIVPLAGANGGGKRYLRRLPEDPFKPDFLEQGWGMRCFTDEPDAAIWCNDDLYDIYSLSDKTAIDGSSYSTW